jgi:hypothetical protein
MFRGKSGDIVYQFVHPQILATLLPVVFFWIVLGAPFFYIFFKIQQPLYPLVALVLNTTLVAHFAIPASYGQDDPGFFHHQDPKSLFSFVFRFLILIIVILIPCVFGVYSILKSYQASVLAAVDIQSLQALFQSLSFGIKELGLLSLMILAFLLPMLGYIVISATQSLGQAFKPSLWLWVLFTRGKDTVVLISSFIGGSILFFIVYSIPPILLITIFFKASPLIVFAIFASLPLFAAPILLGRLAGSFVYSGEKLLEPQSNSSADDAEFDELPEDPKNPTRKINLISDSGWKNSESEEPITPYTQSKMDSEEEEDFGPLEDITDEIKKIHAQSASNLKLAIAEGLLLQEKHPRNPLLSAEMVRLYRLSGQSESAKDQGVLAIRNALLSKDEELAYQVFTSFKKDRHQLKFDAQTLDSMVKIFTHKEDFREAGWCAYASGILANDDIRAQKRLMEVADSAAQGQHIENAIALYQFYLKKSPNGKFADYAQKAIKYQTRLLESKKRI